MIKVKCACGKDFETYNAWIKKGAGLHCSRKCSSRYGKKKPKTMIYKICNECGIDFKIRKGHGGTGRFCSKNCKVKGCGRMMRGENHPLWKGGISERTYASRTIIKAVVKSKRKCEDCNSIDNLHGHHIKPYSIFPEGRLDPNNIKVICSNCHAQEHPNLIGMLSVPRIRKGSYLNCVICDKSYYKVPHLVNKSKTCSVICSIKYARSFQKIKDKNG